MKALLESVNLNCKYSLNTISNPVCVYLKVTGFCDLHCSFCSQFREKANSMAIYDAKKLLKELKSIGVVSINYTGGEPLLYKNISDLLKYGHDLGFEQVVVTNGIHLFDDEKLLDYVNTIGISLHGDEKKHDRLCGKVGVYKKVTDNIDRLIRDYPSIKLLINYTLSSDSINDKDINNVLNFAKQRNIKLCFGRLNYIGASLNANIIDPNIYLSKIDRILDIYNNVTISNCIIPCKVRSKYQYLSHSCGAAQTMYAVEANGDVKICPSSTYVIGNAFEKSFSKVIHSKNIKKFQKLSWLPNICSICKKFPQCKGGCHAEGNKEFFNNTCDALLIDEMNTIWDEIKNKKLIINNYLIRKEKKSYLIMKVPLRKINYTGYKLLKLFDGTRTSNEIVNDNSSIDNIKDFVITLYYDGIIKVKK